MKINSLCMKRKIHCLIFLLPGLCLMFLMIFLYINQKAYIQECNISIDFINDNFYMELVTDAEGIKYKTNIKEININISRLKDSSDIIITKKKYFVVNNISYIGWNKSIKLLGYTNDYNTKWELKKSNNPNIINFYVVTKRNTNKTFYLWLVLISILLNMKLIFDFVFYKETEINKLYRNVLDDLYKDKINISSRYRREESFVNYKITFIIYELIVVSYYLIISALFMNSFLYVILIIIGFILFKKLNNIIGIIEVSRLLHKKVLTLSCASFYINKLVFGGYKYIRAADFLYLILSLYRCGEYSVCINLIENTRSYVYSNKRYIFYYISEISELVYRAVGDNGKAKREQDLQKIYIKDVENMRVKELPLFLDEELKLWKDYYKCTSDIAEINMFLSEINMLLSKSYSCYFHMSGLFLLAVNYERIGEKQKSDTLWEEISNFSDENEIVRTAIKHLES